MENEQRIEKRQEKEKQKMLSGDKRNIKLMVAEFQKKKEEKNTVLNESNVKDLEKILERLGKEIVNWSKKDILSNRKE